MKTQDNYIRDFLKYIILSVVVFSMLVQPVYQSIIAINATTTELALIDIDEDIEEERQESDVVDKKLELQKDSSKIPHFKIASLQTSYTDELFLLVFSHKIPIPPPEAA